MREAGRVRYSGRVGIGEGHPESRQREGVRTGASGSSQRDRPGLQGAWRAGCSADVGIGEARRNARQRERVRGSLTVGIERGVGCRASGSAFALHGDQGWFQADDSPRECDCGSTGAGGVTGSGRANLIMRSKP